ncbi:MAG: hypothetical protein F6J93_16725 [Oscillatoria sp. SIO1A7]|nr:hypothetical protein [Oscillatoria sp. SIO1A7]
MEVTELKMLLKLLGFEDYRAPVRKIAPNKKTLAVTRDRTCRALAARDLVELTEKVDQLTIAAPGRSLLEQNTAKLPISKEELKVLRVSARGPVTPEETRIPSANREAVIQKLVDRGFIRIVKKTIKEVRLSQRGLEFLRDEYSPSGSQPSYSGLMVGNYLRFLRENLPAKAKSQDAAESSAAVAEKPAPTAEEKATQDSAPSAEPISKPSDSEVLQAIRDLDRELGTENYLPIFHLRQKLQPPLSRDELDAALYRLEETDLIELSSLQETIHYTSDQIDAGIPQEIGGPLFFIIVS